MSYPAGSLVRCVIPIEGRIAQGVVYEVTHATREALMLHGMEGYWSAWRFEAAGHNHNDRQEAS